MPPSPTPAADQAMAINGLAVAIAMLARCQSDRESAARFELLLADMVAASRGKAPRADYEILERILGIMRGENEKPKPPLRLVAGGA